MRLSLLRDSPDLLQVKLIEISVSTCGITSAKQFSIRLLPASRGASDVVETLTIGVGTVDILKKETLFACVNYALLQI